MTRPPDTLNNPINQPDPIPSPIPSQTGLLAGYRFQSDDSSSAVTILLFQGYKSYGRPLVPTRMTVRAGDRVRTFTVTSVSYEPLADSIFLPPAVKGLLK